MPVNGLQSCLNKQEIDLGQLSKKLSSSTRSIQAVKTLEGKITNNQVKSTEIVWSKHSDANFTPDFNMQ